MGAPRRPADSVEVAPKAYVASMAPAGMERRCRRGAFRESALNDTSHPGYGVAGLVLGDVGFRYGAGVVFDGIRDTGLAATGIGAGVRGHD